MQNFKELFNLVKKLREPDGCPWDREQTIATLLTCLENEVTEVKEAIEKNDEENLKEELGDILFNMLMILNIAETEHGINFDEICKKTYDKMVERHTWIFGDDKAKTADEALALWKKNKKKNK